MKTAPRTPETPGVGPPARWKPVLLFPLSLPAHSEEGALTNKHFSALVEKTRNNQRVQSAQQPGCIYEQTKPSPVDLDQYLSAQVIARQREKLLDY